MDLKKRVVRVPHSRERLLWLSDIHFPHHDQKALDLAIGYGVKMKADVIVLGGDILDNTPFSRFGHAPKDEDISKWFDMVTDLLGSLRKKFPRALIYWLEGNHDVWFYKYIQSNARVLQNDPYFTLETRLRLSDYGCGYLKEDVVLKFGDMYLHHGHHFFRGRMLPLSPAKNIYSKANDSMLCGHVHRQSAWFESRIEGKKIKCYTTGCLSDLTPGYSPFANYCHGFAFIRKENKKSIVRNIVIDGTIED